MGCDGGTIPKRSELVKTAKRSEQKDKDMDRSAKWSDCTISQQSLTTPIMTCGLGKLYSKESLLEFLLDRSISESASHIRSLKDVKELKLTPNPGYKKITSGLADQYYDTQSAKYVCPVVGLEMNGKYKFCALWTCGCVLSERALKEVETDQCHNCGANFEKDDVIILNAIDADLELMEKRMNDRRERNKALRKQKKEKKSEKRKQDNGVTNKDTNVFKEPAPFDLIKEAPKKKIKKGMTNGKHPSDTSKLPCKKGSSSKQDESSSNGRIDHTKSKVYKNLFTSSEEERSSDQTAHWITYNPYHL